LLKWLKIFHKKGVMYKQKRPKDRALWNSTQEWSGFRQYIIYVYRESSVTQGNKDTHILDPLEVS